MRSGDVCHPVRRADARTRHAQDRLQHDPGLPGPRRAVRVRPLPAGSSRGRPETSSPWPARAHAARSHPNPMDVAIVADRTAAWAPPTSKPSRRHQGHAAGDDSLACSTSPSAPSGGAPVATTRQTMPARVRARPDRPQHVRHHRSLAADLVQRTTTSLADRAQSLWQQCIRQGGQVPEQGARQALARARRADEGGGDATCLGRIRVHPTTWGRARCVARTPAPTKVLIFETDGSRTSPRRRSMLTQPYNTGLGSNSLGDSDGHLLPPPSHPACRQHHWDATRRPPDVDRAHRQENNDGSRHNKTVTDT